MEATGEPPKGSPIFIKRLSNQKSLPLPDVTKEGFGSDFGHLVVVPIYFSKRLCGRYKIAPTDHPDFIGDNAGVILYRLPITIR
jgi:hypothetical protein